MRCESSEESASRGDESNSSTEVESPVQSGSSSSAPGSPSPGAGRRGGGAGAAVVTSARGVARVSDEALEADMIPEEEWTAVRAWLDGLGAPPSMCTRASLEKLGRDCGFPDGLDLRSPSPHERPWTPPKGYICLNEFFFRHCGLWFPLPRLLVNFCNRRRICFSQLSPSGVRNMVAALVQGAEVGADVSVRYFEHITKINAHKDKDGTYSVSTLPGHCLAPDFSSKLHHTRELYFFVKVNPASVYEVDRGYFRIWRPRYGSCGGLRGFCAVFACLFFCEFF